MQPNKAQVNDDVDKIFKAQHDRKNEMTTTINTSSYFLVLIAEISIAHVVLIAQEQSHNRTNTKDTECEKCDYLQKIIAERHKIHKNSLDNLQHKETMTHGKHKRFRNKRTPGKIA